MVKKTQKNKRIYGSGNTFGKTKSTKPTTNPLQHRIDTDTSVEPPAKPAKPTPLEIEIEKQLKNDFSILDKLVNYEITQNSIGSHVLKKFDLEVDLSIPLVKHKLLQQLNQRFIDPKHISNRKNNESFLRKIDVIILDKIFNNHLENIKLSLLNKYFKYKLCTYAAYIGNINILKWAKQNGFIIGKEVCDIAIINNEIDMLKYAIENGASCSINVTNYAIKNHPSLITYLIENGCECNSYLTYFAAKKGDIELLKFLHEKGCPWNKNTCEAAVIANSLECLKYAHENGCNWDEETCEAAAKKGHIECLKYAHENGCPWDKNTCEFAAENGHLECLKYADKNGCPWDKTTCEVAAENGHLDCLKYAHENGCPWDEEICEAAAANGHIDCLKYAHVNGCPWNKLTSYFAINNYQLECLIYATKNGCPCDAEYYIPILQDDLKIMNNSKLIDDNINKAKITKQILNYLSANKNRFVK